eukprot:GEZU01029155.1.p1 GENE.GEZU01029155.1~~GEZU01029155.1.p1  ORF type:complete len:298 (+),score=81.91 GEZU01029155.1:86-895(+)
MDAATAIKIHLALHDTSKTQVQIPSSCGSTTETFDITTSTNNCRRVVIRGIPFMQQNPAKKTEQAKMARDGKKVTWIMCGRRWGLIVDDKIVRRCSAIITTTTTTTTPAAASSSTSPKEEKEEESDVSEEIEEIAPTSDNDADADADSNNSSSSNPAASCRASKTKNIVVKRENNTDEYEQQHSDTSPMTPVKILGKRTRRIDFPPSPAPATKRETGIFFEDDAETDTAYDADDSQSQDVDAGATKKPRRVTRIFTRRPTKYYHRKLCK